MAFTWSMAASGVGFLLLRALHLAVDDRLRFAAAGETKKEVVFELVDQVFAQAQWSDDDLFAVELHEVEAAEGRGLLVLSAAFDSDIVALDVVGKFGHAVRSDRQSEQFPEKANERDGEGGGTAKTGARRRIGVDEEIESIGAKLVQFEAF